MGRSSFECRSSQPLRANDEDGSDEAGLVRALTSERIVFLSSDVNENTITNVQAQLLAYASQNRRPIRLIISTYGGSVDEMFSLYDLIRFLPCPVHTVGLGKVQSAGVLLMAAGTKGRRLIGANSSIMMHPLSGGMQGNIFELAGTVKEAQRKQRLMIESLRTETKMTSAQIRKIMHAGHDFYVTPVDAVKFGIADQLIGAPITKNGFV